MGAVIEHCRWWSAHGETLVHRDEALMLAGPQAPSRRPLPVSKATAPASITPAPAPASALLEVVHTPLEWTERPFSPPLALYRNDDVLIEHQDMNGRQPFYHRNTEVDEISYQVSGERQLVTDIGTVDLQPGDFVKIPVGVAHDNWGRRDIHLLFYVSAPVETVPAPMRRSEQHAFRDWSPAVVPERISARDESIDMLVDEKLLLSGVMHTEQRLEVVRPAHSADEGLAYRSPAFRMAEITTEREDGRAYCRNLNFDEIQAQLRGTRLLVSEIGCVTLGPGDWVRVPAGIAHASVAGPGTYLRVQTAKPLTREAAPARSGALLSPQDVEAARAQLR